MKKIADRRCQKLRMPPNRKFTEVDSSKISLEQAISELSGLGQGFRFLRGEFFTQNAGMCNLKLGSTSSPESIVGNDRTSFACPSR